MAKKKRRRQKAAVTAKSGGNHSRRLPLLAKFDAAQTTPENRRHWMAADNFSPTASLTPAVRKALRSRARLEYENNTYCCGMLDTLANFIVGCGPRLRMRLDIGLDGAGQKTAVVLNKEINTAFAEWSETVRLPEKLRTQRIARGRDGESFIHMFVNPALKISPVRLDLHLYETDQIYSEDQEDTGKHTDGIDYDAFGNPTAYHVATSHPGNSAGAGDIVKVPAVEIVHDFVPRRPGQRRGYPEIAPALNLFAYLRRYTTATVNAAENAATIAGMLENDREPDGDEEIEPFDAIEAERGMFLTLPAKTKLSQFKPEQPTTVYPQFKQELLNEIGRCLHMPFNIAACNSADYNYASGKLDHQTFYQFVYIDQTHIEQVTLNIILYRWLEHAINAYRWPKDLLIRHPHTWIWDGYESVNPSQEGEGIHKRLSCGVSDFDTEAARQGNDFEAVCINNAMALNMTVEEYKALLVQRVFGTTKTKNAEAMDA